MEEKMPPTVGRIVHFYTKDTSKHFNGQGEGPYPAIVTQVWTGSGSMANLKVLPGFGDSWDAGSISEKQEALQLSHSQYWEWPPRVS
jgi:hypothetical protein